MNLSVIIPCYNERATVEKILQKVASAPLPPEIQKMEIVVIDDCSKDGSREILTKIEQNPHSTLGLGAHQSFKLLLQTQNGGKGKSLRTGFTVASGDIILVQDADLEYDPVDYPKLLSPLISGHADVVYGSRFIGTERRVLYFNHTIINKLLTLLSNLLTNINLTDMETCYKVFRSSVIRKINLESNRFGFEPEITAKVAKLKVRIYEVGVHYHGRTYQEGKKITWKDGIAALWFIIKYNLLR